ncbi:unnamed protein product [Urochloa humidicola]
MTAAASSCQGRRRPLALHRPPPCATRSPSVQSKGLAAASGFLSSRRSLARCAYNFVAEFSDRSAPATSQPRSPKRIRVARSFELQVLDDLLTKAPDCLAASLAVNQGPMSFP